MINIKFENFKQNFGSNFLTLSPLGGGYKKWGNSKPIKIRLNPKDEPSILKIERVMVLFVTQPEAKISIKQDFQISKSQPVFEIWAQFFTSELNS